MADCPVGRHELTNNEWLKVGIIRREMDLIAAEKRKENEGENNNEVNKTLSYG